MSSGSHTYYSNVSYLGSSMIGSMAIEQGLGELGIEVLIEQFRTILVYYVLTTPFDELKALHSDWFK
jgi:hypothetical protein